MFYKKEFWFGISFVVFDLALLSLLLRGHHDSYVFFGLALCTYFSWLFLRQVFRRRK